MSRSLHCPHCVRPLNQCTGGHVPLPENYEAECRTAPPLWVIEAGFPGHGKSEFLKAFILTLERLGDVLPGFMFAPMNDQNTVDVIHQWRRENRDLATQSPTPPAAPIPPLIRLQGLPERKRDARANRTLVMYDSPGEFFIELTRLKAGIPAIAQTGTVWFLISPFTSKDTKDELDMADLFHSYKAAIEELQGRASLKKRNVIVVYTMADEIQNLLPNEVRDYLVTDPLKELTKSAEARSSTNLPDLSDFTLSDFENTAERISQQLRQFTMTEVVPGGSNFVRLVEDSGATLKFCATSALGRRPSSNGELDDEPTRFRVLDPFWWTLCLNERKVQGRVRLIFDGVKESTVYQNSLPLKLWEKLSERTEVRTHVLGSLRSGTQPHQMPPNHPPEYSKPRLIGHALELLDLRSPKDKALLITNEPPLDLVDFVGGPWSQKLLVVVLGSGSVGRWPNVRRLPENWTDADLDQIVNRFLQGTPVSARPEDDF